MAADANPELINESPETAPSKRILALYNDGYDKVDDGLLILKEIGLNNIRAARRHLDEWLTTLEKLETM